jgi:hypothetical protein
LGYLYFIKAVNPEHKGISLLVLPVVINFFSIMGFFSFLASLALMFFTIGYFHKNIERLKRKQILIIAGLITLSWFTHFIGALFSLSYIALYIILMGKNGLRMFGVLVSVSVPFVLLSLIFAREATKTNVPHFEIFSELLKQFQDTAPMVCYHSDELVFMRYFQYFILFSFPISLYCFFKRNIKAVSFTPLVFCLLMILAFFIIPTTYLSIKFINIRVLFCALLFFCAFIEMYSPRYLLILTIPIILFVLLKKKDFQTPIVETYSNAVESVVKNTQLLPKGKAVVAMNYSNNWLEYNICLYAASVNKTVILDNEEASTFNSIIRWKKEKEPGENIGSALNSNNPILKLDYEKDANEKIEGLLKWRYNSTLSDSSTKQSDSCIAKFFKSVEPVNGVQIYLRK